ncbi:MAG: DEAD/DEAH box helicase [Syntrophorhabdales bacterium]
MQIILDNRLTISNPPASFQAELRDRLTFPNPQHEEAEKQGRWTGDIERVIRGYRLTESGLIVPRGFAGHAIRLARRQGVPFRFDDRRRTLPPVDFTFNGTLRDFQEEAAAAMLKKDFGTLSAPTGSGKTVMALHLIAARRQPALIVVHTKELLAQWADRIETFLEIPREEIGIIGGGKAKIGQKITVATVQSLVKCAGEVSPYIGHLIIDECHHAPSRTFTDVVTAFDSRFMTGLSATPWRRDGLSRLIFWHVGDVVHEIDRAELMETGNVLSFSVTMRETDFTTSFDPSAEYSRMLSELTEDPERNRLIADVVVEARAPGTALILTDRKNHAGALADLLEERGVHADVLTGDCTARTRREIVERLNRGEVRILIATGQLVGEGFDAAGLTTLFLATPIKFDGRLLQYLGRVLRPAPGKERAEVVDFVDGHVGVLKAAAWARQRVYARAGR